MKNKFKKVVVDTFIMPELKCGASFLEEKVSLTVNSFELRNGFLIENSLYKLYDDHHVYWKI